MTSVNHNIHYSIANIIEKELNSTSPILKYSSQPLSPDLDPLFNSNIFEVML